MPFFSNDGQRTTVEQLRYELAFSTSFWTFNGTRREQEHSDWSEAQTRASYNVEPELFYKVGLTLQTQWTDLYVGYETNRGLNFADGGGSLLDLVLVIPGLERMSTWYRRVRFEHGDVELRDADGWIERQGFSFEIDEVGLEYRLFVQNPFSVSLLGRFQRRAMPRQIYLQERFDVTVLDDDGDERAVTERIYYDISDQLLWVPTSAYEVGGRIDFQPDGSGLHLYVELLAGLGRYELKTPLGGERLDGGDLGTIDFGLGGDYLMPLNNFVALAFGYGLQFYIPEPLDLGEELGDELSELGDTSDFSLSFGAMDLLQRFTVGLIVTF